MNSRLTLFLAALAVSLVALGCGDKTDKDGKTDKTESQPSGGTGPGTPGPGGPGLGPPGPGPGGPGGGSRPSGPPAGGGVDQSSVVEEPNAADEQKSINNLKQIALAMHSYHDVYGTLPPPANLDANGRPLLSWRVHLLPFLEENELYNQFKLDEPWDSANNRPLIAKLPEVFTVPSKTPFREGATSYLVPTGQETMFPFSTKMGKDSLSGGVLLSQVPDGNSNTIMILEAARDHQVPWSKPDDWIYHADNPRHGLSGFRAGGFLAARADASVLKVAEKIDDENLKRAITKADGKPVEIPQ